MKFVEPSKQELAELRSDLLVFEQELDCYPKVASSLEKVVGFRAGRRYWRSKAHGYLYALDLGDFGHGRPSMAQIHGFWDRFEPRPQQAHLDDDLKEFAIWMATVCDGLDPADVQATLDQIFIIRERAK